MEDNNKLIFLLPLKRRFVLCGELFIMIMWQKKQNGTGQNKIPFAMINKRLNL